MLHRQKTDVQQEMGAFHLAASLGGRKSKLINQKEGRKMAILPTSFPQVDISEILSQSNRELSENDEESLTEELKSEIIESEPS